MEAIFLRILGELLSAGGGWVAVALVVLLISIPIIVLYKQNLGLRAALDTVQSSSSAALVKCHDDRVSDLKATITEATKCMLAASTSITNLMVAMERATMSNEARMRSWESFDNALEHYGNVLKNISEEIRDIRRELNR